MEGDHFTWKRKMDLVASCIEAISQSGFGESELEFAWARS